MPDETSHETLPDRKRQRMIRWGWRLVFIVCWFWLAPLLLGWSWDDVFRVCVAYGFLRLVGVGINRRGNPAALSQNNKTTLKYE